MSGGAPSVCFDLTDEESQTWRERQATHFGIHLAQFRADPLLCLSLYLSPEIIVSPA
jgi:hypothetical protein